VINQIEIISNLLTFDLLKVIVERKKQVSYMIELKLVTINIKLFYVAHNKKNEQREEQKLTKYVYP